MTYRRYTAEELQVLLLAIDAHLDAEAEIVLIGGAADLLAVFDSAFCEGNFFPHLRLEIPPGVYHRRRDEFRTDIAFGKISFIHS
jgi:hypothetical protein